jgi:serine/threonine protein kinase
MGSYVGQDSFTPFTLGRYLCQEHLDAGVKDNDLFLAIHLPSGGRRVIQRFALDSFERPQTAEILLKTLLRLRNLSHPNIVTIHEIVRKEYQVFLVMDFFSKVTLQQVLAVQRRTGPFSPHVASFVIWQICQALYYTHHLASEGKPDPLVHGALWPQHILLSLQGEVRLRGFSQWAVPFSSVDHNEAEVNPRRRTSPCKLSRMCCGHSAPWTSGSGFPSDAR